MADRLDARPDHVAVAVPDVDTASRGRWEQVLGGGFVHEFDSGVFYGRQYRYANGGKLELLAPSRRDTSPQNFVRRFLATFGTRVHHVTLKVPDLLAAIEAVESAELDVVDVWTEQEHWKEGFLRPSQVGGLIVQLAQTTHGDEDWARRHGSTAHRPRDDAPSLHGPLLHHPDLDGAARIWTLLGADVERADGALTCRWDDAPIEVRVEPGDAPGPVALRMSVDGPIDAAADIGPPIAPA